jgi:hypothetical protein
MLKNSILENEANICAASFALIGILASLCASVRILSAIIENNVVLRTFNLAND